MFQTQYRHQSRDLCEFCMGKGIFCKMIGNTTGCQSCAATQAVCHKGHSYGVRMVWLGPSIGSDWKAARDSPWLRRSLTAHCREGKLQNESPICMGITRIILYGDPGLMMTDDQQKCTRCLFCAHMIGIQSFWHGSRSMKDFLYCILWFLSIWIHSNSYIESYHHCIVCGFQRWFPGCSRGLWKDAIQRYWFFKDATLSPANDGKLNLTKIFCRKTVTTSHCHSIGQQNLLWKNCCQVAIKLPFLYRFF